MPCSNLLQFIKMYVESAGAEKDIRQSLRDWNQDELNEHLRKDEISCYFLLQQQNFALSPGCFEHEDLYRRKQWRRAQFLADCF